MFCPQVAPNWSVPNRQFYIFLRCVILLSEFRIQKVNIFIFVITLQNLVAPEFKMLKTNPTNQTPPMCLQKPRYLIWNVKQQILIFKHFIIHGGPPRTWTANGPIGIIKFCLTGMNEKIKNIWLEKFIRSVFHWMRIKYNTSQNDTKLAIGSHQWGATDYISFWDALDFISVTLKTYKSHQTILGQIFILYWGHTRQKISQVDFWNTL